MTAARSDAWLAGIDAGCERLVHPGVIDAAERGRQRRFVGAALAAPFLIAPALAQALVGTAPAYSLMAALCATFALGWVFAALVAVTGRRAPAEQAALAAAVGAVAIIIAGGGGLGHPAALLAPGLVFESWWIDRTRRRLRAGLAAAFIVIPVSMAVEPYVAGQAFSAPAWAWLVPVVYLASAALRAWPAVRAGGEAPHGSSLDEIADMLGVPAIRLTPSGEVIEATDEAGALFGMPAKLLEGRSLFERVHVADRVAFMNALASRVARGKRQSQELRLRVAGDGGTAGAELFLPVSVELIRSRRDDELMMLVQDNSALASLRDELEAARETADSTEIAKNRFLAAVSHELRTPLNAIVGFSEMMLNDMAGDLAGRQREYVGLISDAGRHLLSVVNAILDVSRIESGAYSITPEPFAVGEAVEMCRSMMAHQAASKGVSLTVSVRPELREIVGDRRAVQQIMINLLSNAIKFTPSGGSVSLDAYRLGSKVSLVISDTGIGIAEGDIGRLGRPFTQVDNDITRRFEGAGLGLSLVKGLVALHGGELAIESTPGEGTTVSVMLPADGPKVLERGAGKAAPASATVHEIEMKVRDETVRKTA